VILRLFLGAVTATAALLSIPALAGAEDEVTRARFEELARDAIDDPEAREQLAGVTSVEGVSVDTKLLLDGDEDVIRARLETLTTGNGSAIERSSDRLREDANEILAQSRFEQEPDLPRPLRGVLEWLGDVLETVFGPIVSILGNLVAALVEFVPGGAVTLWALAAVIVLVAFAVVVERSARRRASVDVRHRARAKTTLRPAELEREAEEAEGRGDLEGALRLRFLAGLLRLEDKRVISTARFATSAEVARRLNSPDFDEVAHLFDEVVYGRRPAEPADLETTRSTFDRLLVTSGRS
jgi:cytochrome c-type biogenesis protein CcmH/NrfF